MHHGVRKLWRIVKGNLRNFIAFILYVTGLLYILDCLLAKLYTSYFVIFVAHRVVGDSSSSLGRAFVLSNYGMDVDAFEKRLRYILKRFHIISLAEIVQHVRDGIQFTKRCAAITVDDGYQECYSILYPLFQKYHVPATLFITTGVIDTRETFWFDRLSKAFCNTRASFIANDQVQIRDDITRTQDKLGVFKTVLLRLSKLEDTQREQVVEELCETLGGKEHKEEDVPRTLKGTLTCTILDNKEHRGERLYLTWGEINEMAQSALITIGSHSVSHSNLSKADLESAKQEIERSAAVIEQHIGMPVQFFAYPGGAYSSSVVEWLSTTRILGACTSSIGVENDPYRLKRIDMAQEPFFLFAFDISELNRRFRQWKTRLKSAKR